MAVLHTIHTGLTVYDLSHMQAFFRQVLGADIGEVRQIPVGDTLGHITGVPGAQACVCMVTLPGGHVVELLQYSAPASATPAAPRPCDIGAAHLALRVESVADTAGRSQAYGFTVAGQMQYLPGGPFAGQWVAYVRDAQGFTLELIGSA
ncbi:MAG: VOC family protein [Rubrivivax sp.]|jgi:catechol 2,3-dioxygenase-like lactoylglutathione lyase family enzyme|nr:VOC family protein [Rubrivivax sp.]